MSASWTLHPPKDAIPGDPEALDRAVVVRDGFAPGALLSPTLWLFFHRHWVLGIAVTLAGGALVGGLVAAGAHPGAIVATDVLFHLLVAAEGSSLRRFGYARRGRPVADVVVAANAAEAELKLFARWLAPPEPTGPAGLGYASGPGYPAGAPGPAPARAPAFRTSAEPIIGFFPDPEGRRA